MYCVFGKRHLVVFMTFIGMLIAIGSREVFTMVVTHILGVDVAEGGLIKNLVCLNSSLTNFHQDWSPTYIFLFQTSYFVGTIFTQIPGGILAARFLPRRVVGVAIFLTSLLTIALRFALLYKSWLVFLIRILQGIIEGAIVPAFNGVLSVWAPKSEKSVLVTISYAGAYLSAGVAAVTSGIMICRVSWGSALFLYGGVGVLWSLIWLCCIHDSPASCPGMKESERQLFQAEGQLARPGENVHFSEIPWKKILSSLPLSAILVASFCRNWIFALLLTQIPPYFKAVYNMPPAEVGIWSAAPHVMMTVVVICGGFTVDALIKRKIVSTTIARKTAETIGFGVESGCLLTLGFVKNLSDKSAIAILCVGVGVSGIAISGYQVNPLDLAPRYVSILTGIARLGTVGSVVSTVIAVELTEHSQHSKENWQIIFIVAGALHLAGVVYYLIFASGKRQTWAGDDLDRPVNTDYMHHVAREEESVSDDESSPLLSKSMKVERIAIYSEEFDEPSWFMNTI